MTCEAVAVGVRPETMPAFGVPDLADPAVASRIVESAPAYRVPARPPSVAASGNDPYEALFAPPDAIADDIDYRTADDAWKAVSAALTGAQGPLKQLAEDREAPLPLRLLGKITASMTDFASSMLSTEAAMVAMQQLQNTYIADRVKYTLDSIEDQRKTLAWAAEEKLRAEEEIQRSEKVVQETASKGQIIRVVVNWVVSAAQVAMGAFKLATGQPQGALDIAAGSCGMARCALETWLLTDPSMRPKLQEHIDKLAKAEMALSFASMAIDICSAARMAALAKGLVGKVCGNLMQNSLEQSTVGVTLVNAINSGDEAAIQMAKQLTRNIAETVADDVGSRLQELVPIIGGNTKFRTLVTKALDQAAVKAMVEEAVWQAAEKMAKNGSDINALLNGFFNQFSGILNRSITWAVMRVSMLLSLPMTLARTGEGAFRIANGINDINKGEEQYRIQQLMMEVSLLEFLMSQIQQQIKNLKKGMERDTEEHNEHTRQITTHIHEQIDQKFAIAELQAAVGGTA